MCSFGEPPPRRKRKRSEVQKLEAKHKHVVNKVRNAISKFDNAVRNAATLPTGPTTKVARPGRKVHTGWLSKRSSTSTNSVQSSPILPPETVCSLYRALYHHFLLPTLRFLWTWFTEGGFMNVWTVLCFCFCGLFSTFYRNEQQLCRATNLECGLP